MGEAQLFPGQETPNSLLILDAREGRAERVAEVSPSWPPSASSRGAIEVKHFEDALENSKDNRRSGVE